MADVKCPTCNGKGGKTEFIAGWRQCSNCKGTGVIKTK